MAAIVASTIALCLRLIAFVLRPWRFFRNRHGLTSLLLYDAVSLVRDVALRASDSLAPPASPGHVFFGALVDPEPSYGDDVNCLVSLPVSVLLRCVIPNETGTGATPHSIAKNAMA